MHILILPSEEYVSENRPMGAIFQHDQAKILLKEGYQIGAFSFSNEGTLLMILKGILGMGRNKLNELGLVKKFRLLLQYLFLPRRSSLAFENKEGVNVLRVKFMFRFKKSDREKTLLNEWRFYGNYAFEKYCQKFGKPDIIHAHNIFYAGILAKDLSERYALPMLLTEGSSEHVMQVVTDFKKQVAKNNYRDIKHINAVSPALIEQLKKIYDLPSNSIKWFPNVIPNSFEKSEVEQVSKTPFIFLNVANLIELKGQEDLIRAFKKVSDEMPDAELQIIGGGILESQLYKLIEDFNLINKVKLLGYQDRDVIRKHMQECNVFVFPSHYETFGVVLIEAAALGKPLIASKCGGPECIVNEVNGVLCPKKDIQELSVALLHMYQSIEQYDPLKIKADCIARFGKNQFIKKMTNTYEEIVNDYHN